MEIGTEREVDFYTYCKKCKYKDIPAEEDPCDECLSEPVNAQTTKPVKFKEK